MNQKTAKRHADQLNLHVVSKTCGPEFLTWAQGFLDVSGSTLAAKLETPWNTYRGWLDGKIPMPGVACVAVKYLCREKIGLG